MPFDIEKHKKRKHLTIKIMEIMVGEDDFDVTVNSLLDVLRHEISGMIRVNQKERPKDGICVHANPASCVDFKPPPESPVQAWFDAKDLPLQKDRNRYSQPMHEFKEWLPLGHRGRNLVDAFLGGHDYISELDDGFVILSKEDSKTFMRAIPDDEREDILRQGGKEE